MMGLDNEPTNTQAIDNVHNMVKAITSNSATPCVMSTKIGWIAHSGGDS
jgi:hypothetical protein